MENKKDELLEDNSNVEKENNEELAENEASSEVNDDSKDLEAEEVNVTESEEAPEVEEKEESQEAEEKAEAKEENVEEKASEESQELGSVSINDDDDEEDEAPKTKRKLVIKEEIKEYFSEDCNKEKETIDIDYSIYQEFNLENIDIDLKRHELVYAGIRKKRKKNAMIKYIVLGSIILILTILIFILEFNYKYGASNNLDLIVSIAMFIDMGYGALLFIRAFTLLDTIKADTLINFNNYVPKRIDDKIVAKKSFSIMNLISILSIIFNTSILTMYIMIITRSGMQLDGLYYLAFISSILLFVVCLAAPFIFLHEIDIYNKLSIVVKKSKN